MRPSAGGGKGRREAQAVGRTAKKKPRFRGAHVLRCLTRCIGCQLRPGAGKSFSAEKSAPTCASACRVFTDVKYFRLERWGSIPGRTSRPACSFTLVLPFRTARNVWPPLPVPASMLRVSGPCISYLSRVRFPHQAGRAIFRLLSSKPNANAWMMRENRHLQRRARRVSRKSVQSTDNSFL
jgi:hypothetical protein